MVSGEKSKKSVLMIGPMAPPLGGMTVSLDNMVSSGLKERYDLYVLDVTGYRARNNHATVFRSVCYQFYLFCKLIGILITRNPGIVHVNMASYFYFYRRTVDIMICKLFRKKVVFHLHGAEFISFYSSSSAFGRAVIRNVIKTSDAVICLSEYWKRFICTMVSPEKVSVISNGVQFENFCVQKNKRAGLGIPDESVVVFFMGPVGKRKGAFDILEAINVVSKSVKDICFVFCGPGEFKDELDRFLLSAREKGLGRFYKYAGIITGQDKIDYYLSSDIFVLPSYAENLPNALLEAAAAGLPAVVSDVGAMPEVITDSVNGFIVKPGDIAAIAEKITLLAQDKELRKNMGERNRKLIKEKYDMPIIADRIDEVYRSLSK